MADPDAKGAPKPPPNLRIATDEARECDSCVHDQRGRCAKYNNLPVDDEWVCDSWEKGGVDNDAPAKTLRQASGRALRRMRSAQADE